MGNFIIRIKNAINPKPVSEFQYSCATEHDAKRQAYDHVENHVTKFLESFSEDEEYTAELFRTINQEKDKEVSGMPMFSFVIKDGKYHQIEPRAEF